MDTEKERLRAAVMHAAENYGVAFYAGPTRTAVANMAGLDTALDALIAHVAAAARRDTLREMPCELMDANGKDCQTVLKRRDPAPWFCRSCSARMQQDLLADAERAVGEPSHPAP